MTLNEILSFYFLQNNSSYFGLDPNKPFLSATLGEDGLPFPGAKLCESDPYYW